MRRISEGMQKLLGEIENYEEYAAFMDKLFADVELWAGIRALFVLHPARHTAGPRAPPVATPTDPELGHPSDQIVTASAGTVERPVQPEELR